MNKEINVGKNMAKIFYNDKISEEEKIKLIFEIIDRINSILSHNGMWPVKDCQFLIDLSNSLEAHKKEYIDIKRKTPLSVVILEKALTVRGFTDLGKVYGVSKTNIKPRLKRYIRKLFFLFRTKIVETQEENVTTAVRNKIMSG